MISDELAALERKSLEFPGDLDAARRYDQARLRAGVGLCWTELRELVRARMQYWCVQTWWVSRVRSVDWDGFSLQPQKRPCAKERGWSKKAMGVYCIYALGGKDTEERYELQWRDTADFGNGGFVITNLNEFGDLDDLDEPEEITTLASGRPRA